MEKCHIAERPICLFLPCGSVFSGPARSRRYVFSLTRAQSWCTTCFSQRPPDVLVSILYSGFLPQGTLTDRIVSYGSHRIEIKRKATRVGTIENTNDARYLLAWKFILIKSCYTKVLVVHKWMIIFGIQN